MKLYNLLTVYPEFFESFKSHGLIKKGLDRGLISINVINLRNYTNDKHKRVDFKPFGGGPGMIIQYTPVKEALKKIKSSFVSKVTLNGKTDKFFGDSYTLKPLSFFKCSYTCSFS